MAVLVLAADKRLVNLDDAHELTKIRIVHSGAQPMAHVPSGAIVAAADLSLNLESAHALLAVENLPENFKPCLERIVSVLKDCARNYREAVGVALAAVFIRALPFPRLRNLVNPVRFAATRTSHLTVRPATLHQELLASIVSWKGLHQLFEGHHAMKDNTLESIRQAPHNCLRERTTGLVNCEASAHAFRNIEWLLA
jgi:hypothetical protein